MSKKIIIGITGEKGSGKKTFGEVVKELNQGELSIQVQQFSDILRDTLKIWHLPVSRVNMQKLVVVMRNAFGEDVLAKAVYHRALDLQADVLIFDGVRWEVDRKLIRQLPNNFLVYITADPKIRWQRTRKRGQNHGEHKTTFKQFLEEELAEAEISIPLIGKTADFKITNNGSFEEFKEEIRKVYNKILKS